MSAEARTLVGIAESSEAYCPLCGTWRPAQGGDGSGFTVAVCGQCDTPLILLEAPDDLEFPEVDDDLVENARAIFERPEVIGACSPGGDGLHQYRLPPNEYGTSYCLVDRGPSTIVVAHGQAGLPIVDGWLALERAELR